MKLITDGFDSFDTDSPNSIKLRVTWQFRSTNVRLKSESYKNANKGCAKIKCDKGVTYESISCLKILEVSLTYESIPSYEKNSNSFLVLVSYLWRNMATPLVSTNGWWRRLATIGFGTFGLST